MFADLCFVAITVDIRATEIRIIIRHVQTWTIHAFTDTHTHLLKESLKNATSRKKHVRAHKSEPVNAQLNSKSKLPTIFTCRAPQPEQSLIISFRSSTSSRQTWEPVRLPSFRSRLGGSHRFGQHHAWIPRVWRTWESLAGDWSVAAGELSAFFTNLLV